MKDFDPVLKQAVEDIRAVMKRHNIGGAVVLSSKGHNEWAIIDPAWCSIVEHNDGRLRVKLPCASDHAGANASLGHITGTAQVSAIVAQALGNRAKLVIATLEKAGISHIDDGGVLTFGTAHQFTGDPKGRN